MIFTNEHILWSSFFVTYAYKLPIIINHKGVLIYQGAIDSICSVDREDIKMSEYYVRLILRKSVVSNGKSNTATILYRCVVKH